MQTLTWGVAATGDYSDSADDGDEAAPLKKHAAAAGSRDVAMQADTWYSPSTAMSEVALSMARQLFHAGPGLPPIIHFMDGVPSEAWQPCTHLHRSVVLCTAATQYD